MGQHFEDFGSYGAGALPVGGSENWQDIWDATNITRTVQESGDAQYGGKILLVEDVTNARRCLRNNVVPTSGEEHWHAICRIRAQRRDSTHDLAGGLALRAGGAASSESAYAGAINTQGSAVTGLIILRYNAGAFEGDWRLSTGLTQENAWLYVRQESVGATHRAAVRTSLANLYDPDNPGNAPVGGWDISETSATAPASGGFGLRSQQIATRHWYDWIGVAWDGSPVPIEPLGVPAEIRIPIKESDFSGLTLPKTVRYAIFANPLVSHWVAPVLKGADGEINEAGEFVLSVTDTFEPDDLVYVYLSDSDGTVAPFRHGGGPVLVTAPEP